MYILTSKYKKLFNLTFYHNAPLVIFIFVYNRNSNICKHPVPCLLNVTILTMMEQTFNYCTCMYNLQILFDTELIFVQVSMNFHPSTTA